MPGDLESGGRDVCMLERQDRDLYWGPDFRREGGVNVLVCSCLWERTTCVWGGGGSRERVRCLYLGDFSVIEIHMVNSVCTHG